MSVCTGYSVSARSCDTLTPPCTFLPLIPIPEQMATASQACLLPGESSGELMHSSPLHSTFPMPDVHSLVVVHLGGFAFACTNAGKRAQPHKEHSAGAAQQPQHLHYLRGVPILQPRDHT